MQLTIQQAMLKRAELNKALKSKETNVKSPNFSTIEYNLESDGTRYDCHTIEDFNGEFASTLKLAEEICFINNAIAKANNETLVELDDKKHSIQECLNKVEEYRTKVRIIKSVLLHSKESKTRRVDASGTVPYYKVVEANYDRAKMQSDLDILNDKILNLELAISKANNSTYITIK